jgi:hypothetical protein
MASNPYPSRFTLRRMPLLLAVVAGVFLTAGCGLIPPRAEPTLDFRPTELVAASPTASPAPTQTPLFIVVTATAPPASPTEAPTSTNPPRPTFPPPPLPTAAPPTQPRPAQPTPTHPETLRLKMFMIATGDNGASGKLVGCGDSLIPVNIDVPYTQGVLRAALERLLAHKSQFYGESGLYNALYQSNLRIDGLNIKDGEAIIQLSGQVMLGGECDTPRAIAQLEETALQFSTVRRVSITLNGRPIREALSLR